MEKRHRDLILSNRVKLVREMFTERVVTKMRGGLLNETDIEEIYCEESPREKAEAFLSILPRKGPKAFVAFVKALQEVQSHLSEPFLKAAGLPEVRERKWHVISEPRPVEICHLSKFISEYVHELNDTSSGKLTENTHVNKLPENIHSKLCAHLNADNVFGDNWERYAFHDAKRDS